MMASFSSKLVLRFWKQAVQMDTRNAPTIGTL